MVLLALGEAEDFSGESQSRTQIVVPAAQQRLAEAVAATGKATVVLLRTGRPQGDLDGGMDEVKGRVEFYGCFNLVTKILLILWAGSWDLYNFVYDLRSRISGNCQQKCFEERS